MTELAETLASLHLGPQRRLQLVVVASTFMQNNHECVIAWSVEEQRLIRPITNLVTNSWMFGTFTVGQVYWFVILDSNPSKAIWPHKREDTIVQTNPVPVSIVSIPGTPPVFVRYTESEMYNMIFGSSVESVSSVFAPGVIQEGKYILEGTECPSVGILRCNRGDIMFENPPNMSTRCRIFQLFDFPVTAQNRDALLSLNKRPANIPVLVLLGLARPFQGTGGNFFNPRRCYILVIGVIMQGGRMTWMTPEGLFT